MMDHVQHFYLYIIVYSIFIKHIPRNKVVQEKKSKFCQLFPNSSPKMKLVVGRAVESGKYLSYFASIWEIWR